MKRLIGIVLILSIICCTNVMTYVVEASDDSVGYTEAYTVLQQLGIMTQSSNGSLSDSEMSRAEFVSLAVKARALPTQGTWSDVFSDVPSSHWAYQDIMSAYTIGLVRGTSETTFAPDARMETAQAIAIAVKLINATVFAEEAGGYPSGYRKIANQNDLLYGIDADETFLTRENAYQLIYNTLLADLYMPAAYTQEENGDFGVSLKHTPGRNLLNEYLHIEQLEGVVLADKTASFAGIDKCEKNEIIVEDIKFVCDLPVAENLLGKRITVFYKPEESGTLPVIKAILQEKNSTITFSSANIVEFQYRSGFYRVGVEDKVIKYNIGNKYLLLYNYEGIDGSNEALMNPQNGIITLIDNNNDNIYDVILIDEYTNIVVESYDPTTQRIIDLFDSSRDLYLSQYDMILTNINSYENLGRYDIVTVIKSASGRTVRLMQGSGHVSGNVEEINMSNSAWTHRIKDSEYQLSPDLRFDASKMKVGNLYSCYTDAYGRIAYAMLQSNKSGGYMCDIAIIDNLTPVCVVRIYDSRGLITYELDDTVRITTPEGSKRVQSETFAQIYNQYAPAGRVYVLYGENDSGLISEIVLPKTIVTQQDYDNMGDYELYKMDYYIENWGNHATTYKSTTNYFGNWLPFRNDGKVFIVPPEGDEVIEESCRITNISSYFLNDQRLSVVSGNAGNKQSGEFDVYKIGNNNYEPDIMIYYSDTPMVVRDDETISVVEDISMVYNQENDEAKYQISYIQNGTLHTAMVEDNVLCTYEGFSQSTYWTTGDLPNIPSNKNEIKKGDIIKFALNSQGEISKICLMYDAENHVVCYDVVSTSNRVCSVQPAKINIIDDTFCEMTFVNRGDIERGNLKNCRVIIVDETVRNVLVTVGTLEDISKDDLVVFYARYNENRVAVVYKGYIG